MYLFGLLQHFVTHLHTNEKQQNIKSTRVHGCHKHFKLRGIMSWFNFILGLNFISLCFGGMVMYGNEFETKENKI